MDSRRRGKRKSPSQDIIFEVSDNDISSENSEDDCNEPEAKICKIDEGNIINELSNLETRKETLTLEISSNAEHENCIEISEHISVSNSSTANSSGSCSDIIVISEDNVDVLHDAEENYPAPRVESPGNSEGKSADSGSEIIDITDETPVCFTECESTIQTEHKLVSSIEETIVCVVDECSTIYLNSEAKSNLEESEVEVDPVSQVEVDELVDVVGSPLIDVEVHEEPEDVVDNSTSDPRPNPCICITFGDEKMADLYKFKFLKFLQEFVELEVENSEGLVINVNRDDMLDPNEWVVLDNTVCVNETKPLDGLEEEAEVPLPVTPGKMTSKKKKKKKNKKEKELFVLDTNPSENENSAQFTKYSTKFQIDIEKTTNEDEIVSKNSAQTCFNCDSNHALKDCPLPKDFGRINAARQKFRAQKQTSRYHLEEDQKYGHFMPGKISDALREALALRKNQLPPYIYYMRMLGYPPGWLEEAKTVHSNLEMFDSEGNNVRVSLKKSPGLDPEKIVDYPGFNVGLDKNVKDEYRQYRVPPYSETFSKEAMIEYFEKHYARDQDDFETCDMDLDNTVEEKDKVTEMEQTVVVNHLLSGLKEIDADMPSPSLLDLEKQKENLLAALEENSSSNPKSVETCEDPENSSDQDKSKNVQEITEKVPVDKTLEINIDKAEDSSTSYASPPLNSSINCVKTSSFGTPILKSSSPYSKLPNPNNFMKDVSPVINFENLPNSTGKYEQMTGVLQKVRSTLKNRQNCKS